jgi:tRNA (guanine-N7-)-methyltransferase
MAENSSPRRRPVKSFVLRGGRMTTGQERAYAAYWPRLGLERADGLFDPARSFGRTAPLVLEIGFGMGHSLVAMAAAEPDKDFLGVEVHKPGVGKLMALANDQQLANLRVYRDDAVDILRDCIAPASLTRVQLYFPDPWHKKKHHKRRIVQPAFVELVASRLAPEGLFHLATDWESYAGHMLDTLEESRAFANMAGPGYFSPRPAWRPVTKFERRGARLGHGVWDLLYRRQA